MTGVKVLRGLLLSIVIFVAGAVPAAASPVLAVVAEDEGKPWHYWFSVLFVASFLGLVALLTLGYVVRVVMPKYGIRIGKRTTG